MVELRDTINSLAGDGPGWRGEGGGVDGAVLE